jgi:hypothetical protein
MTGKAMQHRSWLWIYAGLAVAHLLVFPGSAAAEPLTEAELEGIALQAEIGLDQTVRRQGRIGPAKITQRWKLTVEPDRTISFTLDSTARTPAGTRKAEPARGVFTLDEPRQLRNRGGGEGLWRFADGTLTFLRTLQAGAFRVSFALDRAGDRLTCKAEAAFARENGRGPIRFESPYTGDEITVVSGKQVSSSCKVSRAAPAGAGSQ